MHKKSGFAPLNLWGSRQGRFVPQLEQKLPSFSALQEGQTQLAAGLAAPQLVQKLPVFSVLHAGQTQPVAAGAGACSAAGASATVSLSALFTPAGRPSPGT